MVKTFIIDWPVLVFLGLVFGMFAPQRDWWRSRALIAGAITAAVFTLVALVSYAIAPDWMWMYFLEPNDVQWAVFVMPAAYAFTFLLGFWSAVALGALGRGAVIKAAVVALLLEVMVVGITWDRYHQIGTAAEFNSGSAHELLTAAPTGPARSIGLMGTVFLAVAIAAFIWARRSVAAPADR